MARIGVDYYDIDHELTEEERLTRDTVRSWVDREFNPIVGDYFERGEFPTHLIPQMAELGLLGIDLEGYGCAGLNYVCYGLACQELERGDSGLRSFVSVHTSLCMYPIHTFGSEEQRLKYLPKMAKGEIVGCFGLTEPDHGSDPAGMETKARKDGDSYVLNGTKRWITNGGISGLAVVWAKTDDGVRGFIVERDTPGFTVNDIHHKLSLRASVTSELIFEDCRILASQLLPGSKGLRSPLMCLNEARFGIAWGAMGAAASCFETAVEYAKERTQFERPIASFQLTQKKLADMLVEITKGQMLAYRLGRLKDAGKAKSQQISLAKLNNVREALNIAREARGILGANGISLEYPIFRHMCNLESVYTYEGTNEVHTLILGQDITGIPAYS
ncbi:MAG: acyl-CoA dehydrogenase family protein [Chloroflexi bacterium]|nr:acyl-CoA dehydrogenase family protein [Chloroflexota bacterium]